MKDLFTWFAELLLSDLREVIIGHQRNKHLTPITYTVSIVVDKLQTLNHIILKLF